MIIFFWELRELREQIGRGAGGRGEVQNEGNPLGELKISCLIEQGGRKPERREGGRQGGEAGGEFPNGRRRRPKKMIIAQKLANLAHHLSQVRSRNLPSSEFFEE